MSTLLTKMQQSRAAKKADLDLLLEKSTPTADDATRADQCASQEGGQQAGNEEGRQQEVDGQEGNCEEVGPQDHGKEGRSQEGDCCLLSQTRHEWLGLNPLA